METILTSAVIAAIVSALFSVITSERRIAAENVIQERKNWRDKVRDLSAKVHSGLSNSPVEEKKLDELRASFSLLVNPHDDQDQKILQLIEARNVHLLGEFIQRIELLLKHDWERAKYEASLWRWLLEKPPVRVGFESYKPGYRYDYRVWRFNNK